MQPVVPFLSWVMEHVDSGAKSVMKKRNLVAKNAFVNGEIKSNCWMRSKQFKRSEDSASVVHLLIHTMGTQLAWCLVLGYFVLHGQSSQECILTIKDPLWSESLDLLILIPSWHFPLPLYCASITKNSWYVRACENIHCTTKLKNSASCVCQSSCCCVKRNVLMNSFPLLWFGFFSADGIIGTILHFRITFCSFNQFTII